MCGIAGILNFDSAPVEREQLLKMARALSHRGPDSEGIYLSGNLGLGHRRLSIIDLSANGNQPMSNEDARIWITYNGEIYNHLKLREELIRLGHRYKSLTDTETIIHLYEEKGVACLDDLDGEFAFSIWDANKKIIFSARDRLGVKPFYYFSSGKSFIFASEIKAILLHPQVQKQIDLQAFSYYLSFSVSPAPLTCFKGISKLEAGHFLITGGKGGLSKHQYWDAIPRQKIKAGKIEVMENIRSRLKDSVSERLMSDVPLGVFLSGGVDSSANVAMMSKLISGPVKTFNVAIAGLKEYDESARAESVSRYFNTDYQSIRIGFDDFYKLFDSLAYHTDEPLCDYACIPNFYLAKLARERGVPVIQVGEGNDELFCGYNSYAAILNVIKHYYPLPKSVKWPLFYLFRSLLKDKLHYSIEQAARDEEVFLGGSYLFTEKEKKALFNDSVDLRGLGSSVSYVAGVYANLLNKFPEADPLDKMIYLDLKLRLPELLLMRADKMTMAHSVEARLPFLDYQFVEYVLSLPSELKYRHNIPKYIFKKSLKGILPREVVFQKKKGFAGNPVNIFSKDFQEYLLGLFKDTEPYLGEYFNLDNIRNKLIFDCKKIGYREGSKIWSIFMLMLWIKRFFVHKTA